MRPIKFRAWDKEDEVMCDVDVIGFSEGAITISNENVKYYHLGINEVVLMQYTGLKDKNGVEVYEGDVVKAKYPLVDEGDYDYIRVVYDNYYSGFTPFTDDYSRPESYEVVGNIYEDEELAKKSMSLSFDG